MGFLDFFKKVNSKDKFTTAEKNAEGKEILKDKNVIEIIKTIKLEDISEGILNEEWYSALQPETKSVIQMLLDLKKGDKNILYEKCYAPKGYAHAPAIAHAHAPASAIPAPIAAAHAAMKHSILPRVQSPRHAPAVNVEAKPVNVEAKPVNVEAPDTEEEDENMIGGGGRRSRRKKGTKKRKGGKKRKTHRRRRHIS